MFSEITSVNLKIKFKQEDSAMEANVRVGHLACVNGRSVARIKSKRYYFGKNKEDYVTKKELRYLALTPSFLYIGIAKLHGVTRVFVESALSDAKNRVKCMSDEMLFEKVFGGGSILFGKIRILHWLQDKGLRLSDRRLEN